MTSRALPIVVASCIGALAGGAAQAQAFERWEFGARAGISVGGGKPANDITYTGVVLKYALSPDSRIGVSVDRLEFDFERPWAVLGLQQDTALAPEVIDAKAKATLVRAFYERGYGARTERWNWNWNVGVGFARPKVPTVSGPVAGGGTFTISTDAGNEIVPSVGAGVRYTFSPALGVELGATLDHHRAKWKLADSVSGRTGRVKSYSSVGFLLGLSYRF